MTTDYSRAFFEPYALAAAAGADRNTPGDRMGRRGMKSPMRRCAKSMRGMSTVAKSRRRHWKLRSKRCCVARSGVATAGILASTMAARHRHRCLVFWTMHRFGSIPTVATRNSGDASSHRPAALFQTRSVSRGINVGEKRVENIYARLKGPIEDFWRNGRVSASTRPYLMRTTPCRRRRT